jgi:16S rRNA (cytosine1402-N4)-methyltransferase
MQMHIPVLLKEVIEYLNPQPGQNFIDCTIGGGGHSLEIAERIKPDGKILGIDWDESAMKRLEVSDKRLEIGRRLILVHDNYRNLESIVKHYNFFPVSGILLDLGFSSDQLESSGRGFSFQKDELLDMRYDWNQFLAAEEIVNRWPEDELVRIFKEYGEERSAARIARTICRERARRPILRTTELVGAIEAATPIRQRRGKIHFATRVFQALRIAVNDELDNLRAGLEAASDILAPGGRLAVISFHSLEDRIVKNFFRDGAKRGRLKILTKKPITPSREEIGQNPRSRSAKLRVAIKLSV